MYDDLLGPKKKPEPKPKYTKWDIEEYKRCVYCHFCGAIEFTVLKDHLKGDRMEKTIQCEVCGCTWKEVWNKDIELSHIVKVKDGNDDFG